MALVRRPGGAARRYGTWLFLSVAAISACHRRPPSAAMGRSAFAGACRGEPISPGGAISAPTRVGSAVDSAATQARVRWAIADLIQSLNSRSVSDLGIRYQWMGLLRSRDAFLERVRASGSTTTLALDTDATRWSEAPGQPVQTLCLSLTVSWFNAGGVPSSQRVALRALAVDDGKSTWLSQLEVLGNAP